MTADSSAPVYFQRRGRRLPCNARSRSLRPLSAGQHVTATATSGAAYHPVRSAWFSSDGRGSAAVPAARQRLVLVSRRCAPGAALWPPVTAEPVQHRSAAPEGRPATPGGPGMADDHRRKPSRNLFCQ